MNEWICVWMPTIWHHLGSVLWLLQLCWTKQSPPGDQRHRWDRALVAEPSSLQGTGLQWSECYPGPWAGEIIIPYSAMNSCLPAAACSLNNDCCVVTVKYSTSMLLREEKESFLLWSLFCSLGMRYVICVSWCETGNVFCTIFFFGAVFCCCSIVLDMQGSNLIDLWFHSQNIPKVLHDYYFQ